jgi:hypothetical protein
MSVVITTLAELSNGEVAKLAQRRVALKEQIESLGIFPCFAVRVLLLLFASNSCVFDALLRCPAVVPCRHSTS